MIKKENTIKKKILILCSIITLMFIFTACGNKTAINTEKFISIMEKEGFTISDATEQFSSYSFAKSVTVAIKSSGNYQIEFFELTNKKDAKKSFEINKKTFESSKGNSSSGSAISTDNYSYYSLTSSGKFMYVSRIDNTMLYIDADDKYEDEIEDIIDKLGY